MSTRPIVIPDEEVVVPDDQVIYTPGYEEVDVKTPRGTVTVRVPTGMADKDIRALLQQRQPELFSLKQRMAEPYQRGFMAHAGRSLKNIVRGLPQMAESLAPYSVGNVARQAAGAAEQWESEKTEGRSLPYRLAAQVARMVGVNVPGMEEAAAQGDPGGVLGEAIVPAGLAAAPLVGEGIGRGIGATGRATARFARDPVTGALTPGVRKAATVGGALAGGGMGGRFLEGEWRAPGALFGAHYGSRLAPRLLDAIIPDLPEGAVAARPAPPPAALPEAAAPVSGTPSESPLIVPEPRGPPALVESISREELPSLAGRGVEGAGEQLSRIGRPVIYEPSGAGYSGVRERVPIESLGRPTPFSEPRLVDAVRTYLKRNESKIKGVGYK